MAESNIHMRLSVVETEQLDCLKEQMDRIEFKLDKLIDALAGDAAGDEPDGAVRSLDGSVLSLPRDENESLE